MTFDGFETPGSLPETAENACDLGLYQSRITGKKLNTWSILRSDARNEPSEKDIELLKSKSIRTVIDMSGAEEVRRKPCGFCGREGFDYRSIPVDEGSAIPAGADTVSSSYTDIAESANIVRVFKTVPASA